MKQKGRATRTRRHEEEEDDCARGDVRKRERGGRLKMTDG